MREKSLDRSVVMAARLIWPFSFICVFVLAMWSNHRSSAWNGGNFSSSLNQLIEAWGWSDAGSYLNLGKALSETGGVPDDLRWIIVLWPAGMPTVYRLAVQLSDLSVPILLSVQLIVGFTWFVALTLVRSLLQRFMSNRIVPEISMLIFLVGSFFRDSMFGVLSIYSDSLTLGLLVAFVGFLVLAAIPSRFAEPSPLRVTSANVKRWAFGICGGLSLAGAALLRSQYALAANVLWIITGVLCVLTLFAGFAHLSLNQRLSDESSLEVHAVAKRRADRRSALVSARVLFALRIRRLAPFPSVVRMLTAVLLCVGSFSFAVDRYLDWREGRIVDVQWDPVGARTLSNTSAFAWRAVWYTDDMLADFISLGGQGTACRIAPNTCAELHALEFESGDPFNKYTNVPLSSGDYQRFATRLLREQPFDWVSDKVPYFVDHATMNLGVTRSDHRSTLSLLWGYATAIGGLLVVVWSAAARKSLSALGVLTVTWLVVLGAAVAPSFIAHFEVRYLVSMFFTERLLTSVFLGSAVYLAGRFVAGKMGLIRKISSVQRTRPDAIVSHAMEIHGAQEK